MSYQIPVHVVCVSGLVINDENELLMVNSNNYGWVFPGGQVEQGENLVDALKREFIEETGIEVQVGEIFCISSNTKKNTGYNGVKEIPTKVIFDFICKSKGGTLHSSIENSETSYINVCKVLNLIKSPAIKERFNAYLNYNGRPIYLDYESRPVFNLKSKTTF